MKFLFLDLETTGLNEHQNQILEVGALITDSNLVTKFEFNALIRPNVFNWSNMALDFHTKSGLLEQVMDSGLPHEHVYKKFMHFLSDHLDSPANLAGNSVHLDRRFIAAQMPDVLRYLTHRHLDVSSFRLIGEALEFPKCERGKVAHRSINDLNQSIFELKYWINTINGGKLI